MPDVSSLSALVCRPHVEDDDAGRFHTIPVFTLPQEEMERSSPLGLQQLRNLTEFQMRRLDMAGQRPDTKAPSVPNFIRQCEVVFQEISECLLKGTRTESKRNSPSACCSWTISYAHELVKQLQELDARYGSSVVKEISEDLMSLTLQCIDEGERTHFLKLEIPEPTLPLQFPVCTVELPISWEPRRELEQSQRSKKRKCEEAMSLVVAIYASFCEAVRYCQGIWNELDDLDSNTWVLEPSVLPPCRSTCERRIALTETSSVVFKLSPLEPRSIPSKVRWIGTDTSENQRSFQSYTDTAALDVQCWSTELSIRENLESCLKLKLPGPPVVSQAEDVTECSICYSCELPNEQDDTLEMPDAKCDNAPCGRHYHESCLREWLQSLPSSRVSFDRILGTCPYCREYIGVSTGT